MGEMRCHAAVTTFRAARSDAFGMLPVDLRNSHGVRMFGFLGSLATRGKIQGADATEHDRDTRGRLEHLKVRSRLLLAGRGCCVDPEPHRDEHRAQYSEAEQRGRS